MSTTSRAIGVQFDGEFLLVATEALWRGRSIEDVEAHSQCQISHGRWRGYPSVCHVLSAGLSGNMQRGGY